MKTKLVNENFRNCDYGAELIKSRGIDDVELFTHATRQCALDYNNLININRGLEMIDKLNDNSKICLIVDCDVDGYTSGAILGQYLKRLYKNLTIDFMLHSAKAHGLEEHWEQIADGDYELVIVPDAGSNDIQYAERISAPILIIDHHLVESDIADNMCVINNQISPNYDNKDLSGAGMAFKFCEALDNRYGNSWAYDYIDLAALGVCADMMSGLNYENQYLWQYGFRHINNYFLMTLARKQGYSLTGKMSPSDQDIIDSLNPISIAFSIVPMINSMIRVGTIEEKQRMFYAILDGHQMIPCLKRGAKGTLEEAAVESVRECTNTYNHQKKMKEDITSRLEIKIAKHDLLSNKILFIRLDEEDGDISSGMNGLIAMQCAQKYHRPTIVARLNSEGYIRGSARGLNQSCIKSFKNFLSESGLFEFTSGHDNAFGISIKDSNLSALHRYANEKLADMDLSENIYEVNFERNEFDDDIQDLIYNIASYKNYWSQMNNEPVIHITTFKLSQKDIQIMGKNADTVKFMRNGVSYMKFFAKKMIEEIKEKGEEFEIEIVGKANVNSWMGQTSPQIFIENYELNNYDILSF